MVNTNNLTYMMIPMIILLILMYIKFQGIAMAIIDQLIDELSIAQALLSTLHGLSKTKVSEKKEVFL